MKISVKTFILIAAVSAAAVSLAADQVRPKNESEAYPKGYYNGDALPAKTAYLTFDDGPAEWTDGILDILKKENIKATFFVCAYWNHRSMKGPGSFHKHKKALRRMVREGHVVGNHTAGHPALTKRSRDGIEYQMNFNQEILNTVLGDEAPLMTIMRPPQGLPWKGNFTLEQKKYVGSALRGRYIVAMWTEGFDSTDSWDWVGGEWFRMTDRINEKHPAFIQKTERIFSRTTRNIDGRGAVILMHDTHPTAREALPKIIADLKSRGYSFATMEDFVLWKYGKSSREVLNIK
jgi:peptidoglycan/xylan/chitin deacetylase (PgdA/CDA1 family)